MVVFHFVFLCFFWGGCLFFFKKDLKVEWVRRNREFGKTWGKGRI